VGAHQFTQISNIGFTWIGFHAMNILYQSLTLANKGGWNNYAVIKKTILYALTSRYDQQLIVCTL
jgi:hypothetical protein